MSNLSEQAAGRIRLRQLQAVDQLIPAMMIANVICSGALALLLYAIQPLTISIWFCLVSAASLLRLYHARRNNKGKVRKGASLRAIRKSVIQAIFMGVAFMSVPSWLLTQTSGLQFTIIICLATGFLWAGGLVLVTIPVAAVAYVTIVAGMIIAALQVADAGLYHSLLSFLFLIGTGTVIRSVMRQSALFQASQQQQIDLELQREVIGVLLKDFEEQGSDWLWETDAELRYRNVSNRFAEALGRPRDKIEGTPFDALLSSAVPGNTEARRSLALQTRNRATFRDAVVPFDLDGESRWWSFSGRAFEGETGVFSGYRGVCADVSAAKRA